MSSRTEFQSANVLLKDRSKPQFVCDLIYLIVWALSNHTVSFTVINKFCIKNTIALIFRLIDSSSSDLNVLELKKNASLDPELVWLLYSEELRYNQLKLCFFCHPIRYVDIQEYEWPLLTYRSFLHKLGEDAWFVVRHLVSLLFYFVVVQCGHCKVRCWFMITPRYLNLVTLI